MAKNQKRLNPITHSPQASCNFWRARVVRARRHKMAAEIVFSYGRRARWFGSGKLLSVVVLGCFGVFKPAHPSFSANQIKIARKIVFFSGRKDSVCYHRICQRLLFGAIPCGSVWQNRGMCFAPTYCATKCLDKLCISLRSEYSSMSLRLFLYRRAWAMSSMRA